MKNFLAVYIGTQAKFEAFQQLPEAERKQREADGMKAWMAWGEKHAAAIVDNGAPLGKTKRAAAEGISDTKNQITGYTVIKAESHAAAAQMFEDHPHFALFPGDSVEIMECLPLPKM